MKIFSDGSDLEGVGRTEDIPYVKLLRKSMWIVDAWPKRQNESQICRYFMIYQMTFVFIIGAWYLKDNTGKLSSFEIGHTYVTVCMAAIAVSRSMMVFSEKYNRIIFYFFNEIHLFNYRNKSDYFYKTHIQIHKISHFFTVYLITMMCTGILLFNLTPMYKCYSDGMYTYERPQNATFDHAVYYALPFDYTTNLKGYIFVSIFNWYNSCTCSTYFCIGDLTISLMVFHLWGHMRILKYNLENFPKPASLLIESEEDGDDVKEHKYTEQESKEVHEMLRENIRYHSVLIEMCDSFGEVLLLYFLFHQVSECLLMLECSQMNKQALLRYGPLTIILFQQLIKLSIIFELLGSSVGIYVCCCNVFYLYFILGQMSSRLQNDKLTDAVYCVPWEYMDTKNRKLVLVMMRQSHRSMNLKAMGVLSVGVQSMISILKTSFSYFVMLRTIAEED